MSDIILQHRTIAEATAQEPPIPTGVWKLRAMTFSYKQVQKPVKNAEGQLEDKDAYEYTLMVLPVEPTASVDREALNEINPRTGKPVHDGKRLFLRFVDIYGADMSNLGQCLAAMGFDKHTNLGEIADDNLVKGKTVYGDVWSREFDRKDGSKGVEQKVRSWSDKGGAESFAI